MTDNAINLTDNIVRKLPAGTYTDAGFSQTGYTLQIKVSPKGKRVFDLLYRDGDKRCRVGSRNFGECKGEFGPGLLTVASARRIAKNAKTQIEKGRNFVQERAEAKGQPRVIEIAEAYCQSLEASGEGPSIKKRVDDIRRVFGDDPIGRMIAKDVTHKDADDCIERRRKLALQAKNAKDGAATVRRVRGYIVTLFNAANIAPNPGKPATVVHQTKKQRVAQQRANPNVKWNMDQLAERCRVFLTEAKGDYYAEHARDMILALLFTANRKSEVLHMRWSQIDFDREVWAVPCEQPGNKTAVAVDVPLTRLVMAMLRRRYQARNPQSDFVFPSPLSAERPFDEKYMNKVITDAGKAGGQRKAICQRYPFHSTVHDVRRLASSWLGVTQGYAWAVPYALNHATQLSSMDAIYAVGDPCEMLRDAMQAFEDWVADLTVVKLRAVS